MNLRASERSEASQRSGAGQGAPASDAAGEFVGRSPAMKVDAMLVVSVGRTLTGTQ
jgi:hypothetical protein